VKSEVIDRGGAHHPLLELARARMLEFVREPEAMFWTFVFPMIMSVGLAIAFPGGTAKPSVIGVEGGEGTASIRQALSRAAGVTVREVSKADEARALREGDIHLLVIPGHPPAYRYDPARDESRTARALADDALKRAAGRVDPFTARDEPVQIAGSRYVDWLIPGLVGMNLMGTSMWGIGFSIVQARLRKLLKRLNASPMRRRDFLLAQIVWRIVFLAPEAAVPLLFGALVLGMPVHGSVVSIAVVCLFGALSFGGLGLLMASRVRTFEAISGLLNITMVPMWVVGGVFFSASNFPQLLQPLIQLVPLTALNNALRGVILEGSSLQGVARELTILAAWGVSGFAIALRIFRWR